MKIFHSVLVVLISSSIALAFDHPGGMHPAGQIAWVKQQIADKAQPEFDAWKQVVNKADSAALHSDHALNMNHMLKKAGRFAILLTTLPGLSRHSCVQN